MSANQSTGRDEHNAGSDTARHYPSGTHAYKQYRGHSDKTADAPATHSTGESAVKDLPQGTGHLNSAIRNL